MHNCSKEKDWCQPQNIMKGWQEEIADRYLKLKSYQNNKDNVTWSTQKIEKTAHEMSCIYKKGAKLKEVLVSSD